MPTYVLTFQNRENSRFRQQVVERDTFEEAVVYANIQKRKMGSTWEIASVSKMRTK
jgi:hypothetical protein